MPMHEVLFIIFQDKNVEIYFFLYFGTILLLIVITASLTKSKCLVSIIAFGYYEQKHKLLIKY